MEHPVRCTNLKLCVNWKGFQKRICWTERRIKGLKGIQRGDTMADTEMEERLRDAETRARDAEAMMIQVQVMLPDEGVAQCAYSRS